MLEYLDVMISALSFPLSESGEEVKAYVEGFKEARSVVERFPTVDAAPVVHGWWTMSSDRPDTIICSNCHEAFDVWKVDINRYHFCPYCGAKMDLEVTDNG